MLRALRERDPRQLGKLDVVADQHGDLAAIGVERPHAASPGCTPHQRRSCGVMCSLYCFSIEPSRRNSEGDVVEALAVELELAAADDVEVVLHRQAAEELDVARGEARPACAPSWPGRSARMVDRSWVVNISGNSRKSER